MKLSLFKQALNLFVEVHSGKSNGVPTVDCLTIAKLIDPNCTFRYYSQYEQPFVEVMFDDKDENGKLVVERLILGMEE